jgi:CRISPR-associated protein Csh2
MSDIIENRSEIVFLYDVTYANPNGDPMEENKPRIDEETGINIVTDVRLKRTIRDYFLTLIESGDDRVKEQDVFIKEVRDEEGYLYDAKTRARDFLKKEGKFSEMKEAIKNEICSKCIDVRLFGGVIPLELKVSGKNKSEKGSITLTGPVQFRFGRSLHRVDVKYIQGTGAFAADYEGKKSMQFTFREEYILPYSLICFYGLINENAAKTTGLTENDVELLMEGMLNGTKNLITRSKAGQMPRFLMRVVYNKKNFHIGDLDKMIKLVTETEEEKIRDISEVKIDISELVSSLKKYKNKIEKIEFKADDRAVFLINRDVVSSNMLKDKLKEGAELDDSKVTELKI